MRHERSCHVFKDFLGKCTVCGERFTTSKLSWNAIKLWNDQCSVKSCQPYFEKDVIFPLSKKQVDIFALRISYDMEYFSRHPNDTLKKMLLIISTSMIIVIERDVLKRHQTADFFIQEQFKKVMN
jgi:hypothetical protein